MLYNYCIFMHLDEDFNSTSFNITINIGDTYGRANVTLSCDKKMEGVENFSLNLAVIDNNPLLAVVRNTTTVQIFDIIGKQICNRIIY